MEEFNEGVVRSAERKMHKLTTMIILSHSKYAGYAENIMQRSNPDRPYTRLTGAGERILTRQIKKGGAPTVEKVYLVG